MFSRPKIVQLLTSVPQWALEDNVIVREFKFRNFKEAMNFVNQVAQTAEQVNHHPDIEISYSQVKLKLSTHDAGGVTEKDFDLATRIDQMLLKAA